MVLLCHQLWIVLLNAPDAVATAQLRTWLGIRRPGHPDGTRHHRLLDGS